MSKDQSLQLKGIAIAMMLFLHLFNTMERVEECTTLIPFFNGRPLVYVLARVCGLCVPIFLFISGYGLAHSQRFDTLTLLRRLRRVLTRYWLVFAIFIPVGCLLQPQHYPGSALECLLNVLTLSDSYNGEWWFLLPYILLLALSRWIIPQVRRSNARQRTTIFLLLFGLSVAGQNLKHTGGDLYAVHRLVQFLSLLPAFYAGACCALGSSEGSWYTRPLSHPLAWMTALLFVRCFIGASVTNVLFCVPFILLFIQMTPQRHMQSLLRYLGRHSTVMWLTHTFYAYYFFHAQLYGLRYPLFIYAALLTVTLLTAIPLEWAAKHLAETGKDNKQKA